MSATATTAIQVSLDLASGRRSVGRLALRDQRVYFEYSPEFLDSGLELSPLRLPLRPGLLTFDPRLFDGLPGLFNDSLPDGWGRLLFDRARRARGLLPGEATPLDRLAHVGSGGMGALVYEPDLGPDAPDAPIDLDRLADQSRAVLEGDAEGVLDALIALNGSSAGARPKAMIAFDPRTGGLAHGQAGLPDGHEPWLVKFATQQDGADAGAIEQVYALMARSAGLAMTPTRLLRTARGGAYFATRRFDRDGDARRHVHTVSGLLHSDHRIPALDYEDLVVLTLGLTRDIREVEAMVRLAAFNVLAHNRDDHAKNIAFLMTDDGRWRLAPAYDLTFSSGPGGEQSTTIMGQGRAPGTEALRALGKAARLSPRRVEALIEQTRDALAAWPRLATEHGVSAAQIRLIGDRLDAIR
ncbi:type II toxin-antitoxin system HipA family toxin [Brevundimonas staleyi]|uniref:Type II toxin-antitoxin system HipA family toxin n=1 Tax=Brevundimonas staleyi TaxID=74326 RepID=A0ABW0FVP4_9CAUL